MGGFGSGELDGDVSITRQENNGLICRENSLVVRLCGIWMMILSKGGEMKGGDGG
jgi:hypothetical protein